jgi:hypothetical protein
MNRWTPPDEDEDAASDVAASSDEDAGDVCEDAGDVCEDAGEVCEGGATADVRGRRTR